MTYRYNVVLEPESDGGFHAFCPALRGCHSEGDTLQEALENIKEAIAVYLESMQAHQEPLPPDDVVIQPVEVALDT